MNNCKNYIEQMNMYLDGELKATMISELLAHIESCPECKKRFETLKIISFQTRDMEGNIPKDLHEKIMNTIKNNTKPAKKMIGVQKILNLAAIAAVFIFLISGVSNKLNSTYLFYRGEEATTGDTVTQSAALSLADADTSSDKELQKNSKVSPTNGETSGSNENIKINTDEEFAFFKVFVGKEPLPDFVNDFANVKDSESGLYYIYVDNNEKTYKEFTDKLLSASFTEQDDLYKPELINEDAKFGLYILYIK